MRSFIIITFFVIISINLISCSENDNPTESASVTIKGLWKATDPSGGGELLESDFKDSGQYIFLKHESVTEIDSAIGIYQLDGDLVTINTDWGNGVYKWMITNQDLTFTLVSGGGGDLGSYLTSVVWKR